MVTTRLGRSSPSGVAPGYDETASAADVARARGAARSRGRFTRNFVVQGTAAEWALCWMAGLRGRLRALGGGDGDSDGVRDSGRDGGRGGDSDVGSSNARDGARDGRGGGGDLRTEPHLVFFLHDEVVVHCPDHLAGAVEREIREAAADAGRLLFGDAPVTFPVTVASVDDYGQAK